MCSAPHSRKHPHQDLNLGREEEDQSTGPRADGARSAEGSPTGELERD